VSGLRLHWSPRSPFVRKVMIAAHETGTVGRIETVRTKVAMVAPNRALLPDNPLGKIPTLVLADGSTLYDSVVICEYLDTLHDGPKLFPAGPARFVALTRHALGNGMLDALILWRNERERAAPMQVLLDAFALKTEASLAALERIAPGLAATPFGIGHIAIGCALSYLDFRFATLPWREARPNLAAWHASFDARPSVQATQVVDDA
jgi:glutathione S-transferase